EYIERATSISPGEPEQWTSSALGVVRQHSPSEIERTADENVRGSAFRVTNRRLHRLAHALPREGLDAARSGVSSGCLGIEGIGLSGDRHRLQRTHIRRQRAEKVFCSLGIEHAID